MKQKLFLLASLPLVLLAVACGSSSDNSNPATTVSAVGVTCPSGQVIYNNQCYTPQSGTQYGYNYNNGGYNPVNVTIPQNSYCGTNGYPNSYGQGNCWANGSSYRWSYAGGVLWYW